MATRPPRHKRQWAFLGERVVVVVVVVAAAAVEILAWMRRMRNSRKH